MDDYGPAEAPMPSKCLQKWQEKPKLAVVQQSHQILPIKGWEGEGEYPEPEIRNSRLRNGDPDRRVRGPPGWGLGARPATQPRKNNLLNSLNQVLPDGIMGIDRSELNGTQIYGWPTGKPKIRWRDDVRKGIQKLKVPIWKILAQDRRGWKEKLVEKAKTL